eukprot:447301_1
MGSCLTIKFDDDETTNSPQSVSVQDTQILEDCYCFDQFLSTNISMGRSYVMRARNRSKIDQQVAIKFISRQNKQHLLSGYIRNNFTMHVIDDIVSLIYYYYCGSRKLQRHNTGTLYQNELNALHKLNKKIGFLEFIETGKTEYDCYIITKLLKGKHLLDALTDNEDVVPTEGTIAKIICEILKIVQCLHDQNIVHRNIVP